MKDFLLKKFKCIIGDNILYVVSFLEVIVVILEIFYIILIGCYVYRFNLLVGDVYETFKFLFLDLERVINKFCV